MEMIKGNGEALGNIDLAPANAYQEVVQNISVILAMVQKSAPMLREMGISGELYGRPLPVVENTLVGYIYDQIEEYEPRAILGALTFERDGLTGKLVPVIELEGLRDSDI
ncbi:MAG: hypothetical protein K2J60_17360 [Acetatifactor sp.]|nr:hypothetical protein [Acetatifactor sp.]